MADYYGCNKEVLIQGGIGQPLFIALFEDEICVVWMGSSKDWENVHSKPDRGCNHHDKCYVSINGRYCK